MPERSSEGSSDESAPACVATSWFFATTEMRSPCPSMPTRKSECRSAKTRTGLPRMGTSKRHRPERQDEQQLDQAEDEVGQELAEHDLEAAHRRGEELLHRAALPLAGHGERGEQDRADGQEVGGEAGDHEERRAGLRVVAGPDASPGAGGGRAGRGGPGEPARLGAHEGVRLGEHLVRGHGVGAVDDELDPGAQPLRARRARSPPARRARRGPARAGRAGRRRRAPTSATRSSSREAVKASASAREASRAVLSRRPRPGSGRGRS